MTSSQVRRPEAVLLSSTTSAEVARVFIGTWASWFGVPADISSDQGPQFTSELWNAVAEGLGMRPHCTTGKRVVRAVSSFYEGRTSGQPQGQQLD